MTDSEKFAHTCHIAIIASHIYTALLVRVPYNTGAPLGTWESDKLQEIAVGLAIDLDRETLRQCYQ